MKLEIQYSEGSLDLNDVIIKIDGKILPFIYKFAHSLDATDQLSTVTLTFKLPLAYHTFDSDNRTESWQIGD